LDAGAVGAAGQFNNTGSVATTVTAARAAFLDGPSGSNSENRLFTQTMGTGDDVIYGGNGSDYVMAGNGNDTIYGGAGNDIMYGRGGNALSGSDNDTFVWQRGDAGTAAALDIVRDFTAWNGTTGDRLNITQLLEGYTAGASNLAQWVKSIQTGVTGASLVGSGVISGSWDASQTGTLITIDVDGAGGGTVTQRIFLASTTLSSTDVTTLQTTGLIIA
jgi:Ca2+-binding RTX toxin-like protein